MSHTHKNVAQHSHTIWTHACTMFTSISRVKLFLMSKHFYKVAVHWRILFLVLMIRKVYQRLFDCSKRFFFIYSSVLFLDELLIHFAFQENSHIFIIPQSTVTHYEESIHIWSLREKTTINKGTSLFVEFWPKMIWKWLSEVMMSCLN